MKKGFLVMSSAVLSIAFLAMSLTTLMLPEVKGFYGEYTIRPLPNGAGVSACRCDHMVQPPSYQDAWTGTGIAAYYDENSPPAYHSATFIFQRGYGGTVQWPHTWTVQSNPISPMYCQYQYGYDYGFLYYDYRLPAWDNGPLDLYWAYYQDLTITKNSFSPYPHRQITVGADAQSYFIEVANPNNRIYISSPINPSDMYAPAPHWR